MHEVLVNHLGGLSLPRKSVVRLTYRNGKLMLVNATMTLRYRTKCQSFKVSASFKIQKKKKKKAVANIMHFNKFCV